MIYRSHTHQELIFRKGKIDMKRKMAIVLSAVMALTMGMTAMAAPSPSIQKETVQQVVVSSSIGTTGAAQATSAVSEKSAVLPGTTFTTASGQVVDAAAVAIVTSPATAEQAQTAAASLAAAIASADVKVMNFTGLAAMSLTDASGNLNIVNNMTIGLATASGEAVAQNGSISAAFALSDILGGATLAEGETVQALYQRADGTWVAVPVVIANGAIAIALPAFGGAVNVTFIVAKGAPMSAIPAAAATKSERARPSTLRDWPPCPPIQRGGGRRSRPGVTPFISALTVARCPVTFPGV